MERTIEKLATSASLDLKELYDLFREKMPEYSLTFIDFEQKIQTYRKTIQQKFNHNINVLASLREHMREKNLDCLFLSTSDEYINEYVSEYAQRIRYLTNFTGSLAACLITLEKAVIFIDGRYTLQAYREIDVSQFAISNYSLKDMQEWVSKNINNDSLLGIVSRTTSIQEQALIDKVFACKTNNFLYLHEHIIDSIWKDQPEIPLSPVSLHTLEYAGKDAVSKVAEITNYLQQNNLKAMFITATDEIAWLLNIRGSDIKCNPVVLSYCLLIDDGQIILFIDDFKITNNIKNILEKFVQIVHIDNLEDKLKSLPLEGKILLSNNTPIYFLHLFQHNGLVIEEGSSFINLQKSIKNPIELAGTRTAHIEDAIANIKFYYEVYNKICISDFTEISLGLLLQKYRSQSKLYKSDSFDPIVAINDHGAIVHYKASEKSNKYLTMNDYLLLDSGGQYLNGTTDLTRTMCFKVPSSDFKEKFTMVLKGHIALAKLKFPSTIQASALDSIARQFLWNVGLDYKHGTGHGVGVYGCVHEGAISISPYCNKPLKPGMIFSNEPGYYEEGKYGIRLENLYIVKDSGLEGYYEFENLTFVPFDTRSISFERLTQEEYNWLLQYHNEIFEKIAPYLSNAEKKWLRSYSNLES